MVVHSVHLIIITAVFAGAGRLRVRWSIIWSWWLFWFSSSIYSTRLLWFTCIICSVMWGRAVHFYASNNILLGFAGYANHCIVAFHCLDEVRVYVWVPIFDFLTHQHRAHYWEKPYRQSSWPCCPSYIYLFLLLQQKWSKIILKSFSW